MVRVVQERAQRAVLHHDRTLRRYAFRIERGRTEAERQQAVVDDRHQIAADARSHAAGQKRIAARDVRRAHAGEHVGEHVRGDVALEEDRTPHRCGLTRADHAQGAVCRFGGNRPHGFERAVRASRRAIASTPLGRAVLRDRCRVQACDRRPVLARETVRVHEREAQRRVGHARAVRIALELERVADLRSRGARRDVVGKHAEARVARGDPRFFGQPAVFVALDEARGRHRLAGEVLEARGRRIGRRKRRFGAPHENPQRQVLRSRLLQLRDLAIARFGREALHRGAGRLGLIRSGRDRKLDRASRDLEFSFQAPSRRPLRATISPSASRRRRERIGPPCRRCSSRRRSARRYPPLRRGSSRRDRCR